MRPFNRLLILAPVAALLFLSSCAAQKDTTIKSYDVGAKVEVGHLIYTVFETQWLTQIGAGDTARVPKNRFFLIRMSAVNSGSEEMLVPNMVLLDDQNKEVEELSNGEGVAQWTGYVRKVRPAESMSGNIVFDAEPRNYRLKISDEEGEKFAYINLPLNLTSETPQMPAPATTPDMSAPPKK